MKHKEAKEFVSQLGRTRDDLPYSPDLLRQLFDMTRENSSASLEQVGDVLGRDQGLTAKVLVMANSAFYGLQAEVAHVNRAVAVLGLKEVRNIVLTLGMRGLSRKAGKDGNGGFDLCHYWAHQFSVAVAARAIARFGGDVSGEDMFTAGLLHDLGKLILFIQRPDDWAAIDALAKKGNMSFFLAEDEYWGVDHGVIGSLLLKSWGLPEVLCEAVNWHHAPDLCRDYRRQALVLGIADGLVHLMTGGETPQTANLQDMCESYGEERDELLALVEAALEPEKVELFVKMVC